MSEDDKTKDLESAKSPDKAASEEEQKGSIESSSDEGVVIVASEDSEASVDDSSETSKEEKHEEPKEKLEEKPKEITKEKKESSKKREPVFLPDFPYDFKTVITVLGVIALLVFLWSLIFHPAMRIDHIDVNGNYEFSDDQIMDALDIHIGDYILKPTFLRAIALRRSTPYVEDVDVHISFPSGIIIDVTERHKLAYIRVPDGYVAIDQDGVILEFTSDSSRDVHPVLCGLDIDGFVVGQRTDITDSLKFRKMILVLGAVLDADRGSIRHDDYHFYDSVREVRVVSSGLIFLTVELPDGTILQVKLNGIDNIDDNMQWLLYAIRADAFEGLPAGSLDMTEDEKIYRAYNT